MPIGEHALYTAPREHLFFTAARQPAIAHNANNTCTLSQHLQKFHPGPHPAQHLLAVPHPSHTHTHLMTQVVDGQDGARVVEHTMRPVVCCQVGGDQRGVPEVWEAADV